MDNLTHSLVGALMGQMGLKKKTGLGMPALIIGANIPDVDAACFFWLEGTEHLGFRRGITHGPPAMVLLPLVLAAGLWWFDRWQAGRGKRPDDRLPVSFKWLYILSFLACLSHPIFDWFNVYGIRFWEPFAPNWAYGDTLFIIDVWLWALFGLTTWWSLRAEGRGSNWKRPAWIGALVGVVYIGTNFAITTVREVEDSDVAFPGRIVIASPSPVFSWKREMIIGEAGRYTISSPVLPLISAQEHDEHHQSRTVQTVGECQLEPVIAGATGNSQAEAFLRWSRTPFVELAENGGVILYDARFYDPRARDRFSIALPDVQCVPIEGELPED
ncbi:metal-dependent hydrolase [Erythrobacter sp. YT30]|uniref:metal-dependent hydrolase n=1 Tax=Erythrobacter sp. YT30 TaxID=1735012 RepID=UPI00076D3961|nr:metal-dependent hydrolase [Erythrobacter sp. YT30]KWV93115.1 metal-dependent hydrolase [Erythrobacter sp. YT30]